MILTDSSMDRGDSNDPASKVRYQRRNLLDLGRHLQRNFDTQSARIPNYPSERYVHENISVIQRLVYPDINKPHLQTCRKCGYRGFVTPLYW